MAELVDAPASGAGARKGVEVRVLFWAPSLPTASKTLGDRRKDGPRRVVATINATGKWPIVRPKVSANRPFRSPICYGKLLRDLAKGLARRGRKLHYRHTIPVDAQRLLNRLEIWRSLRTGSLAIALRRLPTIIARIEMEIEHAREVAGLPVDTTLIQSLKDDLAEHAIPLVVQHNPHRSGAYLRRELARRGPSSQELGPPTNPGRFRPRFAGLLPNFCSTSR